MYAWNNLTLYIWGQVCTALSSSLHARSWYDSQCTNSHVYWHWSDQNAQPHISLCFHNQGVCCMSFFYRNNNHALHQHGAKQPKLFAHSICHHLNIMHNHVVTPATFWIITVSTACTLCTMWKPPAWHNEYSQSQRVFCVGAWESTVNALNIKQAAMSIRKSQNIDSIAWRSQWKK